VLKRYIWSILRLNMAPLGWLNQRAQSEFGG
jgi:hypothetical protein